MTAAATDNTAEHETPEQATVTPVPTYTPLPLCGCGHERDAHEHHRSGSDCGVCGAAGCRRFRRRTGRGARSSLGRR